MRSTADQLDLEGTLGREGLAGKTDVIPFESCRTEDLHALGARGAGDAIRPHRGALPEVKHEFDIRDVGEAVELPVKGGCEQLGTEGQAGVGGQVVAQPW